MAYYKLEFDYTIFNENKAHLEFGVIEIETTLEQHEISEDEELLHTITSTMQKVVGKEIFALRINKVSPTIKEYI